MYVNTGKPEALFLPSYIPPEKWEPYRKELGLPQRMFRPGVTNRVASGLIMLSDHPYAAKFVDGNGVFTVGYVVGTYEYTAVSGGKKTVRKYSSDLAKAFLLNH